MSTVSVLIIEKNGDVRPLKIKEYAESDLYKKAGFKSAEGFKLQTSWVVQVEGVEHKVLLFAKSTGKAGSENKYDFPPPVDTTLFFGACVLVGMKAGKPVDLTVDQWTVFYEFLFGGFEDLGSDEDEADVDTDEEIKAIQKNIEETTGKKVVLQVTKQGYMKDDFIVDDESDESEEYVPRKNTKKNTKEPKKSKKVEEDPALVITSPPENEYLDCTSELTYEEYRT
jgi:hypothetical protein